MSEKQYKVGYFDDPNPVDSYVENSDGEYLNASDVTKLLNNYDAKLTEIEEIIKNFDKFWALIPKGYCSGAKGAYIVMEKMLETIEDIREEVNNDNR